LLPADGDGQNFANDFAEEDQPGAAQAEKAGGAGEGREDDAQARGRMLLQLGGARLAGRLPGADLPNVHLLSKPF